MLIVLLVRNRRRNNLPIKKCKSHDLTSDNEDDELDSSEDDVFLITSRQSTSIGQPSASQSQSASHQSQSAFQSDQSTSSASRRRSQSASRSHQSTFRFHQSASRSHQSTSRSHQSASRSPQSETRSQFTSRSQSNSESLHSVSQPTNLNTRSLCSTIGAFSSEALSETLHSQTSSASSILDFMDTSPPSNQLVLQSSHPTMFGSYSAFISPVRRAWNGTLLENVSMPPGKCKQ